MGILEDVFRLTYGKSVKGRVSHSVIYWFVTIVTMITLVIFYALQETTVQEQRSIGGSGCTRNPVSIATEAGSFTNFQPGGNCTEDVFEHIRVSEDESAPFDTDILTKITYNLLGGASIALSVSGTVTLNGNLTSTPIRSNGITVIAKCDKFSGIGAFTSACASGHTYTDGEKAYDVADLLPWNVLNITLTQDTGDADIGSTFQSYLKSGVVLTIEYLCVVVDAASTYTCDRRITSTPYQILEISSVLFPRIGFYHCPDPNQRYLGVHIHHFRQDVWTRC
ncbi:hypothetical protein AAMO2058_001644100 [Amorphochlora amoebiformis]